MKVLRVIASKNPSIGGHFKGIRNSFPAVRELGHTTEVVSLDSPEDQFVRESDFAIPARGGRGGAWAYNSALAPWLRQHISAFDAVIVHGLWLYPSYAVCKVTEQLKRRRSNVPPYAVMPHGMLDPWFQKTRWLKGIRNRIYWKLIEHHVIRESNALFFTCEEEMRLARQPFQPYEPQSEIVIGYGIADPGNDNQSLARRFRDKLSLKKRPLLLFLGRLDPKKGLEMLINAYADCLQSVLRRECQEDRETISPDEFPALLIAGPCADNAYLSSLQQLASSRGIDQTICGRFGVRQEAGGASSRLFWMPMLSGDDKWGAFHACDAFILPSHQENFGISVVEAMACGKPVLLSDKVNIWREIEQDRAGMIAPDTVAGTRDLINRWFALPPLEKERMGQYARRSFETRFHVEKTAKRLVRAIEDL